MACPPVWGRRCGARAAVQPKCDRGRGRPSYSRAISHAEGDAVTLFRSYAAYYDLLYRDKDYAAEAQFVNELLLEHAPGAGTVLDLGCGTGRHAIELARLGYTVHGIDRSGEMLAFADRRRAGLEAPQRERLSFSVGDIRDLRLGATFDVILALFHVMSYQTSEEDLRAAVATARGHLNEGGVFLFDFWYGPAIVWERPQLRTKQVRDRKVIVTRTAEPVWDPAHNVVHVHYQLTALPEEGTKLQVYEVHSLRYFFEDELQQYLYRSRFKAEIFASWMSKMPPGREGWSAYAVARAVSDT
jgi:SAM-dependent methyltransferase